MARIKASSFKVSGNFYVAMDELRWGIEAAAREAMAKAMEVAEQDARAMYSWRQPGTYTEDYPSGTWEWTVTGMSAASITAYVVPDKKLKRFPAVTTTTYWNGIAKTHVHQIDPALTGDYNEEPGKVKGVVTMYTGYAPYLQAHETGAGGQEYPVTVEVLEVNWETLYCPKIIQPTIEKIMTRIARRLK